MIWIRVSLRSDTAIVLPAITTVKRLKGRGPYILVMFDILFWMYWSSQSITYIPQDLSAMLERSSGVETIL